ncbi:MAG: PE-PPE domain-containing protein, partial [Mycobacterium sp.]
MSATLRPYITTGVALVGASLIAVTPVTAPQSDVVQRGVRLTSNEDIVVAANGVPGIDLTLAPGRETIAYEMGGSHIQILPESWFTNANEVYVQPNYPGAIPNYLGYPAQLYPGPPHSGFLDPSEQEGQQIMNQALMTQLGEGHNVVFYGTSQSATI